MVHLLIAVPKKGVPSPNTKPPGLKGGIGGLKIPPPAPKKARAPTPKLSPPGPMTSSSL